MNTHFLARGAGLLINTLRRALLAVFLAGAAAHSARGAYDGPVPSPSDAYGRPGPYAVVTETFPSPAWPGQVVTVYRPDGVTGPCPTWFFAHGFSVKDPAHYREFLSHLASHGAVVVFSPYPTALLRVAENHAILYAGYVEAAKRYPNLIDTSRVGFAGHSYGAGALPAVALRAVRERGWGSNGLALFLLAPWYCYFVSDADLASFPAGTQAVVQIYEDDTMNDHRIAIDLFTHLNIPDDDKDFLMVRSDRIDGYNYIASHRVPAGASTSGEGVAFNALDAWGILRVAQALGASAWQRDPAARAVALGNGSAEQTQMGVTPDGRALRPMVQTDRPVALFPSSRYVQPWDGSLNPRFDALLPQPTTQPHLANLSARARSAEGADVLIAGAIVTGSRPKSLLIRAVGPGLAGFGVGSPMPDPRLVTFRGSSRDIDVDNWSQAPDLQALETARTETGAFVLAENSKDAALLASFSPGTLTMHAPSTDGVSGVVLLELYDADQDEASRLSNLSMRARVGGGDDILIAGFVAAGGGELRLLIRGIGPALTGFGLTDVLSNPRLEIFRNGEVIAANDDWSHDPAQAGEIASVAARVGAFPLAADSKDASLLFTASPGSYTAHLRASDDGSDTGVGMIEIYVVP
ncbi:MAG TPA: hypothetical protein VGD81_03805 [Opitutaceae bacterium]